MGKWFAAYDCFEMLIMCNQLGTAGSEGSFAPVWLEAAGNGQLGLLGLIAGYSTQICYWACASVHVNETVWTPS